MNATQNTVIETGNVDSIDNIFGLPVRVEFDDYRTGERRSLSGKVRGVGGAIDAIDTLHVVDLDGDASEGIDDKYADVRGEGVQVDLRYGFVTLTTTFRERYPTYVGENIRVVVTEEN